MKYTLLVERDGHDRHVHGIAIVPSGFNLRLLYMEVMEKHGEEWNYSDIFQALKDHDIQVISDFNKFYEDEAY